MPWQTPSPPQQPSFVQTPGFPGYAQPAVAPMSLPHSTPAARAASTMASSDKASSREGRWHLPPNASHASSHEEASSLRTHAEGLSGGEGGDGVSQAQMRE